MMRGAGMPARASRGGGAGLVLAIERARKRARAAASIVVPAAAVADAVPVASPQPATMTSARATRNKTQYHAGRRPDAEPRGILWRRLWQVSREADPRYRKRGTKRPVDAR